MKILQPFGVTLCIVCICAFFGACIRDTTPPITTVSGNAYYLSPLSPPGDSLPLQGIQLMVKDINSGSLYYPVTDSSGLFTLPGIPSGDTLQISGKYGFTDSVDYKAAFYGHATAVVNKRQAVSLLFTVDTAAFNALVLTVNDKNGGNIAGSVIYGYPGGEIAALDTGYQGFGSTVTVYGNSNGQALAMQLASGPLYLRSQFSADSGRILLRSGVDTLTVQKYGPGKIVLK